jgi:hypothetical protein
MSPSADSAARGPSYDYTAVGHVTIDEMRDGSRRPGGGAFYSGLQAARLGQRTLILTRGVAAEIEAMLEPYAHELSVRILPAQATTTLQSAGDRGTPAQRLLAWAGPIAAPSDLDTAILHLAPVARETPARWHGRAAFVGLTAQGLLRAWPHIGAELEHRPLSPREVPRGCNAIVLAERERESASELERRAEALVAVTRAAGPTLLLAPGEQPCAVEVPAIETVRDDVGAGDVFAAALFTSLHRGAAPREATEFAHAAAAVRISGAGAAAVGDSDALAARLRALA